MKSSTLKSHTESLTPSGEGVLLHEPTDGKRAWMPHPLLQSTLFAATKPNHKPQRIERVNAFGDKIRIDSPRLLTTGTDLPVFLATLALAQKSGIREYHIEGDRLFYSTFPIRDLYEVLCVHSKNKKWLTSILYDIGRTSFLIEYKNPEKHRGRVKWESDHFWAPTVIAGRGRAGSVLRLRINQCLIPRPGVYLYAQVESVSMLKSAVAKGIFWALLCREALRASVSEWHSMLGATDEKLRRWRREELFPALEELSSLGYSWRECENGDFVIRRPGGKGQLMP